MDIVGGLAAASQAISIARELREIDRSVDESVFKLKIADLQVALADAKVALSEAKLSLATKDEELAEISKKLSAATSGETCPVCNSAPLKTRKVVEHHQFGRLGVQEKHLECSSDTCNHSEKRMHDPVGLLNKS